MRVVFLIIVFLLIKCIGISQCDSSLVGSWKPISIFTGEIYYNFATDSIDIDEEMKQTYPDSTSREMLIEMVKMAFGNIQFTFNLDGSFEMKFMEELKDTGSYCFKLEKSMISMTSKNSLDQPVTTESKASLIKGVLHLKMNMGEEDIFELTMRRVSNHD
jgi:hypothetical protein